MRHLRAFREPVVTSAPSVAPFQGSGSVRRGPRSRPPSSVVLVSLLVSLALGLLLLGHVADDAYISLRYARNLAEGHGPVWNVGEAVPVEGYSNLLWMLMMAAFERLAGEGAMRLTQLVGLLAALGCVLLAPRLARSWGAGRLGQSMTMLFVAVAPTFAFWAVSGMETSAYALALLGGVLLLRTRRTLYPVPLAAAALLRPEGAFLFALLWAWRLGMDLAERERRRPALSTLRGPLQGALRDGLLFSLLYVPALAWRVATYGSLVPNSVHAKFLRFDGLRYLVGDALQYFAPHVVALVAVAAITSVAPTPRRDRIPLWLLPLGVALLLVNCRPVMGYYFRFFWPVLPLVFVASGLAIEALQRRWGRTAAILVAIAALAYPLYALVPILRTCRSQGAITDTVLRPLADWVAERPGDGMLAMSDCGLVPYASRAPVIDLWGLNDLEIARDGFDPERIVARRPDVVALVSTAAASFEPLFPWEGALQQSRAFRGGYQRVKVLSAPAPIEYHMWVYERIP